MNRVYVLIRNEADRKRLFEAVKDIYLPFWENVWNGRTYFETGFYSGTHPCQAVMDTVYKTYMGMNDNGRHPMTVEEFINKYIHNIEGEIIL